MKNEKLCKGLARIGTRLLIAAAGIYIAAKCSGLAKGRRTVIDVTGFVEPSYGEAVDAIVNRSGMTSSYAKDCIAAVKSGENADYYRAVISIAESDMISSYKLDAIKNLK